MLLMLRICRRMYGLLDLGSPGQMAICDCFCDPVIPLCTIVLAVLHSKGYCWLGHSSLGVG